MVSWRYVWKQLHLNMDSELVFWRNGRYQLAQNGGSPKFAYLTAGRVAKIPAMWGVIKLAENSGSAIYRYAPGFWFW